MSLSTISVPSLHNGVSQQPAQVRSADQCAEQENFWISLADGLLKRPPTEAVAQLSATPIPNCFVHDIDRDVSERYPVVAAAGVIRVFTPAGVEVPVTAPGGWGYLSGITDYTADISMTTVADYTFIVNRKTTPAMRPIPEGTPVGTNPTYPAQPGAAEYVAPRGGSDRTGSVLT